jgi:hypothetical protein
MEGRLRWRESRTGQGIQTPENPLSDATAMLQVAPASDRPQAPNTRSSLTWSAMWIGPLPSWLPSATTARCATASTCSSYGCAASTQSTGNPKRSSRHRQARPVNRELLENLWVGLDDQLEALIFGRKLAEPQRPGEGRDAFILRSIESSARHVRADLAGYRRRQTLAASVAVAAVRRSSCTRRPRRRAVRARRRGRAPGRADDGDPARLTAAASQRGRPRPVRRDPA